MQVAGSSAIVVGGAGGLGEATVRRLHGAGQKSLSLTLPMTRARRWKPN